MMSASFIIGVATLLLVVVAPTVSVDGAPYVGPMPHPPTAPAHAVNPAGSLALPQSTLNFAGTGHAFDCVNILTTYWPALQTYITDPTVSNAERGRRSKGMIGVAIARTVATGQIHAYFTNAGSNYMPAANPGMPLPVNVPNAQPGWIEVDLNPLQRAQVRTQLQDEFGAARRRCFGTPRNPWRQASGLDVATQPTCAWSPVDAADWRAREVIERNWPVGSVNMAPELGIKGGECALTKLAHYFRANNIAHAEIACAAELTPSGWPTGRSLDSVAAPYIAGEVVSSCVTCQHAVPFLLGATCPLRNAVGGEIAVGLPPGATTVADCPRTLMDGDTCRITCPPGQVAAANGLTTCTNGQLVIPRCVPNLKTLMQKVVVAQKFIKAMQPSMSASVSSDESGTTSTSVVATPLSSGLVGGAGGSPTTVRARAASRSSTQGATARVSAANSSTRSRSVSPTTTSAEEKRAQSPVGVVRSIAAAKRM